MSRHPLLLNGTAVPPDGLHLVVAGKAYWVSPAMLRAWVAADPDSPTGEEGALVVKLLGRMHAMEDAIRREVTG